ncbi:MAG: TAXI family TRAP transporter solute-binding subunit [Deltaproteobacteria bacterium]|nr:TAXI family TRAP transporter solute-binding subunit [Deltaproteobacteria bacterium]
MDIQKFVRLSALAVSTSFAAALLVAPPLAYSQKPALPHSVNFGTHAVGSVFNSVGTGLAKVASDHGPIRLVVQPFSGPPAWIPSTNREGKPEIGIINVTEIWQAFTGKITPRPLPAGAPEMKPPYGPHPNLRLLTLGTDLSLGILVRNDSPIKSMADLKGKRLTWDFPAFPANILSGLAALSTAGVSIRDIQTVPVPEVVSGVRALMEGRVDGAVAAVGMGIVSEADARVGVRYLPASQDPAGISVAQGIMPGGNVTVLRPGPAGIKVDTPIWSYGISIVASTHMSEEAAYSIIKTWWEHWKELGPMHPQFRAWNPDVFVQERATIPYHPGAIKLYKEKGKWSANMDKNQAALLRGELPMLR